MLAMKADELDLTLVLCNRGPAQAQHFQDSRQDYGKEVFVRCVQLKPSVNNSSKQKII